MRVVPALAAVVLAVPFVHTAAAARTLTLAEMVKLATEQSTSARLGGLAADRAAAHAAEQRGVLLPQVTSLAARSSRTSFASLGVGSPLGLGGSTSDRTSYDLGLELSQTLFDWSSWQGWRAASTERDACDAEGVHARESAATTAAQAALGLARAAATVAARRADRALAEDLLAIARTRRDAGTAAQIDVTRARVEVTRAQSDVVVADHERAVATVELERALALEPGSGVELADSLDDAFGHVDTPGRLDEALARATAARHDLAAAGMRRDAAREQLGAARGEWIPRVEFVASTGWSGERTSQLDDAHRVGVQLEWTIADGLSRQARIADRAAAVREADVTAADVSRAVAADVREAWSALEAGRMLERVAAERQSLALDEVAQARLKLQEGLGGNLDVIAAQSSLVRARDAVIDAHARSAQARIALARAMGVAADLR